MKNNSKEIFMIEKQASIICKKNTSQKIITNFLSF